MTANSPKEYLKDLRDLPSLPAIALQALAVAEDPSSTASDLLRVIMSDPPLAAKVLKVANSVHFHRGYAVNDLQTAIVRLGFSNVRNLLMGVAVIRAFNSYFVGAPYTREDFWVHSIAVGVTASRLSGESVHLCASSSFVMGLLHDIGQLVLDRAAREAFRQAIRVAQDGRIPLFEAERRLLGCDHSAVGGELLASWRFPQELVEPVRWHHEPERCEGVHRPHAFLLQAADWICDEHQIGSSANEHPTKPSHGTLRDLNLTEESIAKVVEGVRSEPLLSLLLPI
ncbi:MAG TPA: HDOD domain-containing protein [Planctomycetota bacterium]|nr:HDOD domain-containing protein [Planctomycetota bacterium]